MRLKAACLIGVVTLVATSRSINSQEPAPAQPPAEAQVAQEFKKAAPELFRKWMDQRPGLLRNRGLGELTQTTCTLGPDSWQVPYIKFLRCQDSPEPGEYRIDVRRTDSVLTPFVGVISVAVRTTCMVNGINLNGLTGEVKAALAAACVGVSYEECLAASATAREKTILSMTKTRCSVDDFGSFLPLATPFSHKEDELTYSWTEGRWEFQRQH